MKIVNTDWYITVRKCLGISHKHEKILIDNDLDWKLHFYLEYELVQKTYDCLSGLQIKTTYQLQLCDL